ncbi:hypothetical protein O6H91_09G092900 [Diphasiastrum complanatum]|uniref:Uncharacterized protein n=3 Tax=Diphasiastrum complanatum TaxID=34168 RepID=A0ACC2CS62_DIPCM|nr:hypothetical protein O6H91_09G092900 [Diphasiastrum complanatum]KAJ7544781.1 hypothetical protein O6H91_09G092900 [Diphasiastrum complanatum]KAJ7544782.1 hypothetical protein O6H91_09G092900 [Diphasiastrum complanatum]
MSEAILKLEHNSSLTVLYGETFGEEDLKLLEVDESILQEVLQNGVTIKGVLDDEAVLCTSTTTYAIKFVATSNMVLLIPSKQDSFNSAANSQSHHVGNDIVNTVKLKTSSDEQAKVEAVAAAAGHIELVEIAPRLERLKELLSRRPYAEDSDGDEVEDGRVGELYTWDDLMSVVQASEKQLREGLKALAAIEVGNYWRIVDPTFMQGLLEVLILNAVHYDWPLTALPGSEVIRVLQGDGYSPQIVKHCLATYGSQVCSSTGNSDTWALDEKQICLHYARQLLSAVPKWRLEDFLDAWQQNLPTGLEARLDILKGEALIDKLGSDSWVRIFSLASLPTNPAERFGALFKERSKWEWQDLEPYLGDLKVPGLSVEAMLLKFTRKTQFTADAAPIYTAR